MFVVFVRQPRVGPKWTLNEDGTVRQLWEILEEEKVVGTAFDVLYRRKE